MQSRDYRHKRNAVGYASKLDFDSRSADKIEERLEVVRNILRKYGGSFESLQRFYEEAVNEAQMLSNATERVEELEKEIEKAAKDLLVSAKNCPRKDEKLRISLKRHHERTLRLGYGRFDFQS